LSACRHNQLFMLFEAYAHNRLFSSSKASLATQLPYQMNQGNISLISTLQPQTCSSRVYMWI
jgi:hypothetical protein